MNKKTVIKILLDISMTILYLMLMFGDHAASFFHEFAGIGIGVLFLYHLLLNSRSLKGMLQAKQRGRSGGKLTLGLLLDLGLTAVMPTVIVTGILISEVLFQPGVTTAWFVVLEIHNIAAYLCLGILALHVAVHANYLVKVTGTIAKQLRTIPVKKAFGRFAAGTMAACTLYVLVFTAIENAPAVDSTEDTAAYISAQPSYESSSESQATANASDSVKDDSGSSTSTPVVAETLKEYLSKLYCTACHNHCPLSSPRCGRSAVQIAEATADYNELYYD